MGADRAERILEALKWYRFCGYQPRLNALIADAGLRPGHSWEQRAANLIEDSSGAADDMLEAAVREVVLFGRKSIRIGRIDPELAEAVLATRLEDLTIDLAAVGDDEPPTVVGIARSDDSVRFVIRQIRTLERTDDLDLDWARPERRAELEDVARVVAYRRTKVSAYDVVEVWDDGRVDVRIADEFQSYRTVTNVSLDGQAVEVAANAAAASFAEAMEWVDLAPAIRNLYDAVDEGRVIELRFECDSGAVRGERMRASKDRPDLREEPYHAEGMKHANFVPYGIAVGWDRPRSGGGTYEVELLVIGTRTQLHSGGIRRAVIHKAHHPDDYRFALDRLVAHL